jgi:cytochrome c oxidase cbb3-type subunit IV
MFDAGTAGVISTILMLMAIIGIGWWAFAPRRKKRFDDASKLPFADDPNDRNIPNSNGDRTAGDGHDSDDAEKRN